MNYARNMHRALISKPISKWNAFSMYIKEHKTENQQMQFTILSNKKTCMIAYVKSKANNILMVKDWQLLLQLRNKTACSLSSLLLNIIVIVKSASKRINASRSEGSKLS